jgi:transposase-like protein
MPEAISKDIKDQVLARVREGKETVVEIARQHGLKVNTVYGWLSRSAAGWGSPILQTARLKRENAFLKQLLGQLMLDMERGKKNRHD